jgi:flagellar protein FlgJ
MSTSLGLSSPASTASNSYLDFQGLGELKGQAQQDEQGALRKTAEHFEGLFIQMMMKSMRDANSEMKSDLVQSDASDQFESMFDKELSVQMAKRNSMGFADMLVNQLSKSGPAKDASALTLDGSKVAEQKAIPLNKPAKAFELKDNAPKGLPIVRPFIKPLPPRPLNLGEMNSIDTPQTSVNLGGGV